MLISNWKEETKAAFESSQTEYSYELSGGLISNLLVDLIWESLCEQNWGRGESQLVLNNYGSISFSVAVQLWHQVCCLFTDRCIWNLRATPSFALPQWTAFKKLYGHRASLSLQDRRCVLWSLASLGQWHQSNRTKKLPIDPLSCSQLQSAATSGGWNQNNWLIYF